MRSTLDYTNWGVSDMLINYQAGFVRRGLLGDLLFRIYAITPFDVSYFLLTLILVSAVGCLFALYRISRHLSYSPVLVFCGFTLQFMALAEIIGIRRDYLTLLLCLLSFWLYRKWLLSSSGKALWLVLCQVVMIISVLLHEGSWFYITPLLCLHLMKWSKCCLHEPGRKIFIRCLAFVGPVVFVMALLYANKGNVYVAQTIWSSWQPLFCEYPLQGTENPDLGQSVSCLACSTIDFVKGCGLSLWGFSYCGWLPMFPFTLALFPILIYLVTFANHSGISSGYSLKTVNQVLMITIMIVQLCFMSPLFLFLSCDYGRLYCYWVISSIFAYYFFRNDQSLIPPIFHRLSLKIQKWISKESFFCTPLGYVSVLVLTPCNMVGGAALGAIPLYRMVKETPFLFMELFH